MHLQAQQRLQEEGCVVDIKYPLCSEIDVAMTLLCLMLVTRARVP